MFEVDITKQASVLAQELLSGDWTEERIAAALAKARALRGLPPDEERARGIAAGMAALPPADRDRIARLFVALAAAGPS